MRKLKLQHAHIPDGFAPENSDPTSYCDEEFRNFSLANLEQVDCIILGRITTVDFIPYWAAVAENPDDPDVLLGKKLTEIPKVIFSRTLEKSEWENATLANGELVDEINKLKNHAGKDIMVYGGDSFVASLMQHDLIDEYYLAVNPADIDNGLPIIKELERKQNIALVNSKTFDCGMVCSAPQNLDRGTKQGKLSKKECQCVRDGISVPNSRPRLYWKLLVEPKAQPRSVENII